MDISIPSLDISGITPELILIATAMIVLLLEVFLPTERKGYLAYLSLVGLVGAFLSSIYLWGSGEYAFGDMMIVDNFGLFFNFILFAVTFLTILMSINYLIQEGINHGEYYALVLFALVGMMLMVAGSDLIVIFLGLETFSVAIYVLSGFLRTDPKSNESALKYFLLGAFSTGFLLYGIALIYGATGNTQLKEIALYISQAGLTSDPILLVGMGLLIVGFGFKVALVPFHMWVPDVYEGAPTSITAFMSVAPKAAGFAAFLRVFLAALGELQPDWTYVLWVLAVLTMTLGNVVAIAQTNIIRMLAYSSIAHAGYILVAMVAANDLGTSSILFYLLAYTFMNLGAFGVVILYGRKGKENTNISDYSGMASRYPLLGAAMAVFMFSLAGIPPTAGFVGKFYIFTAAVKAGFVGLAIIGVLNSLISVFFYLRVTVMMYMREPEREVGALTLSPSIVIALIIAVLGTIQMGLFPSPYLDLAAQSVQQLTSM